jgi:dihydroorotase
MALYAEAFDAVDALDTLERFASINGPEFYGLPVNQDTIHLINEPSIVPQAFRFGDSDVRPFRAGESISWRVESR